MVDETETLLRLDFGIAPYSARGITQSLDPISASAKMRRTMAGTLLDVSTGKMQKYSSVVACSDFNVPALDGVWPGRIVQVDCVQELSFETSTGGASREVVPGSERESGGFTFYRPRLTMMVVSYSTSRDEWQAGTQWQLVLEEV